MAARASASENGRGEHEARLYHGPWPFGERRTMVRPEDRRWWEHMEQKGPRSWARGMFMLATMTLAMYDKPLKERLRIAYTNSIYPLFVARDRALEEQERPALEDIFYAFYETREYRGEQGEGPVRRAIEGMSGERAEDLAAAIVRLSFGVCSKIPPNPGEP